jgi:hypothetical protein
MADTYIEADEVTLGRKLFEPDRERGESTADGTTGSEFCAFVMRRMRALRPWVLAHANPGERLRIVVHMYCVRTPPAPAIACRSRARSRELPRRLSSRRSRCHTPSLSYRAR